MPQRATPIFSLVPKNRRTMANTVACTLDKRRRYDAHFLDELVLLGTAELVLLGTAECLAAV